MKTLILFMMSATAWGSSLTYCESSLLSNSKEWYLEEADTKIYVSAYLENRHGLFQVSQKSYERVPNASSGYVSFKDEEGRLFLFHKDVDSTPLMRSISGMDKTFHCRNPKS